MRWHRHQCSLSPQTQMTSRSSATVRARRFAAGLVRQRGVPTAARTEWAAAGECEPGE